VLDFYVAGSGPDGLLFPFSVGWPVSLERYGGTVFCLFSLDRRPGIGLPAPQ